MKTDKHMATIKMAAVSSSTRLLMNLWTAFIGLPESWIAGVHAALPGTMPRQEGSIGYVQKLLAGLPPDPNFGPSHCRQTGQ
ncbi:hypothetical protein GCM10023063_11480 [Arthrobacter methylotrophus]